jgi:hypothetical protein
MKLLKTVTILTVILLAFCTGIFIGLNNAPQKVVTNTTEDCPNWICTTRTDSRSVKEYVEQCQPKQAVSKTGEYGYFCTGDFPVDMFNKLPSDWGFILDN